MDTQKMDGFDGFEAGSHDGLQIQLWNGLDMFGLFGLGGFHVAFLVGIWADHLYFLQKQNSNLLVSSLKDSLSLGAESSPPDPSTFALPSHAPVTTCQTWRGPQESTELSQKILSGERLTLITSIKNMQKYALHWPILDLNQNPQILVKSPMFGEVWLKYPYNVHVKTRRALAPISTMEHTGLSPNTNRIFAVLLLASSWLSVSTTHMFSSYNWNHQHRQTSLGSWPFMTLELNASAVSQRAVAFKNSCWTVGFSFTPQEISGFWDFYCLYSSLYSSVFFVHSEAPARIALAIALESSSVLTINHMETQKPLSLRK